MAPLSEHEQKILDEIEANMYADDPRHGVRGRAAARQVIRIAVVTFVVGLGLLFGFFMSRWLIVGVLAFVAMVGGIVLLTSGVRALMAAARSDPNAPKDRIARAFGDWQERIRHRYKRP